MGRISEARPSLAALDVICLIGGYRQSNLNDSGLWAFEICIGRIKAEGERCSDSMLREPGRRLREIWP